MARKKRAQAVTDIPIEAEEAIQEEAQDPEGETSSCPEGLTPTGVLQQIYLGAIPLDPVTAEAARGASVEFHYRPSKWIFASVASVIGFDDTGLIITIDGRDKPVHCGDKIECWRFPGA